MSKYPDIVKVRVENFMGYEDNEIEFDESGIINLKGYNSSGKSSFITAIKVLFFNYKQNKHVKWIKRGEGRFVIQAYFDDGCIVERGKLRNGKSWYALYNEIGEELYSTIEDGVYIKITGVPEVIRKYLGLNYDTKLNPHFLKSRDKLFLVDTTGSENYMFLNQALQGEELVLATELAKDEQSNAQRNLDYLQNEMTVYQKIYLEGGILTGQLVKLIEEIDNLLTSKETDVTTLKKSYEDLRDFHSKLVLPKLDKVEPEMIENLGELNSLMEKLVENSELNPLPKLDKISNEVIEHIQLLENLLDNVDKWSKTKVIPKLDNVEIPEELEKLSTILDNVGKHASIQTVPKLDRIEYDVTKLQTLLDLRNTVAEYFKTTDVLPMLDKIDLKPADVIVDLSNIHGNISKYEEISKQQVETEKELTSKKQEYQNLLANLSTQGYDVYKCTCCGEYNLIGEDHVHDEEKEVVS